MNLKNTTIAAGIIILFVIAWTFFFKKKQPTHNTLDTIIVGTNVEYPPFAFIEDDNKIVGFEIDVVREVVEKRLGKKMILKQLAFDALIPEVQMGTIHIVAAGMTPAAEREKRVFFARPHFVGDPLQLVSLATRPIHSVHELIGKRVIVNEGYTSDTYASTLENVTVVRIASAQVSDGILALKSNRGDALLTSKFSLKPLMQQLNSKEYIIATVPGTDDAVALVISKEYPELLPAVQNVLDAMKEDGTLDALIKKWQL